MAVELNNFSEGAGGMDNPERQQYQKDYWAAYKKNRRQVKGVLSQAEFVEIESRANLAGNSVWQQIRQESEKYVTGEYLSTAEIRENIQILYLEIRGIANTIKATRAELGEKSDAEMLARLAQLEERIEEFTRRPWGINPNADDEK